MFESQATRRFQSVKAPSSLLFFVPIHKPWHHRLDWLFLQKVFNNNSNSLNTFEPEKLQLFHLFHPVKLVFSRVFPVPTFHANHRPRPATEWWIFQLHWGPWNKGPVPRGPSTGPGANRRGVAWPRDVVMVPWFHGPVLSIIYHHLESMVEYCWHLQVRTQPPIISSSSICLSICLHILYNGHL